MKTFDTKKVLIIILSLITLASLCVTFWALFFRGFENPPLTPDYAPQEQDKNQEDLEGGDTGKLESPDGGGAASIIYAKDVYIDLSEKRAALLFGNPKKSDQDMVVQLVIQDEILIQSGLITPGHKVQRLELLNDAERKLKPGGYDGKLVILCYNRESGEKSIVNTEILVTVTVAE